MEAQNESSGDLPSEQQSLYERFKHYTELLKACCPRLRRNGCPLSAISIAISCVRYPALEHLSSDLKAETYKGLPSEQSRDGTMHFYSCRTRLDHL